jgi:hypothetical protein
LVSLPEFKNLDCLPSFLTLERFLILFSAGIHASSKDLSATMLLAGIRLRPINPQPEACILLQVEFDLAAFPLSLQTTPAAVRSGCIEKHLKKNAAASLAKGRLPSFGQQRILSVILDAEVDAEVDLMERIALKVGPTGEGRHRSYEQHRPFQNSGLF